MYMNKIYRFVFVAILIAIFAGCSAPKPITKPLWYTSPPQDYQFFYATGSGETLKKAKNKAISSLRNQLNAKLDAEFTQANHPLGAISKTDLSKILKQNAKFIKSLPLRNIKIDKSTNFKGRFLVLIKMEKKRFFEKIEEISNPKFVAVRKQYESLQNEIAIKRFSGLNRLLKEYPILATYTQLKKNTVATYRATKEFSFLKKMNDEYNDLKARISFYILSDGNSQIFTRYIKRAIKKEGLQISKVPLSKDSLKLIIKSVSTDSQEYSFMKSSTLIKLTTYDMEKNKVSFRQHTFVGKSRKSYKEAKDQSAVYLNGKIKKFGLYDFIGL